MTPIEDIKKEMKKLEEIRNNFYALFDKNLPKDKNLSFDFSSNPKLDAKEVYNHFFKLDYQARKIRGLLIEAKDIKVE